MIDDHLGLKWGEFKLAERMKLRGSPFKREKALKEALLTTLVCKAPGESLRRVSQLLLQDAVFFPTLSGAGGTRAATDCGNLRWPGVQVVPVRSLVPFGYCSCVIKLLPGHFFVTAILRNPSHSIQYRIQWFRVDSQSCTIIGTIDFRMFLITPRRNPGPVAVTAPSSPLNMSPQH